MPVIPVTEEAEAGRAQPEAGPVGHKQDTLSKKEPEKQKD
jgi:hypothetical protein